MVGRRSKAAAYLAHPPRSVTRSLGDYTFVLRPAPYYEKSEDKYIQQITKTMVNIGGLPGEWDKPLACRWKWCRWTSPTPTGWAACSAR